MKYLQDKTGLEIIKELASVRENLIFTKDEVLIQLYQLFQFI